MLILQITKMQLTLQTWRRNTTYTTNNNSDYNDNNGTI